jgi:hypothetical protein
MSFSKLGVFAIVMGGLVSPAKVHAQEAPPVASPTTVHIEGSADAVLQMQQGPATNSWVDVCQSPCGASVPADATYRIRGDGLRPSRTFMLDGSTGHVVLNVSPATTTAHTAGMVVGIGGGAVAGVGLFIMLFGAFPCMIADRKCQMPTDVIAAGAIVMGVGLGGLIGGAIVLATHSSTGVKRSAAPPVIPAAAQRLPTWNERDVVPGAPWAVPLVAATF